MLNQYDSRWKNDKLGTGSSTIGSAGCYLTCICEGLNRHGYSFTPKTLNDLFKQTSTYTNSNLLTASVVAKQNPSLFAAGYNEAWDDNKVRAYLKVDDVILIGEVDARGISGTGQHFVLIFGLVESNGKIVNTKIGDSWGGLENLASVRYGKYGYIKSLRVFRVKNKPDNQQAGTSNNDGQIADNFANHQTSSQGDDMLLNFLGGQQGEEELVKNKLIEHLGINGQRCGWGDASGPDTGGFLGSERRTNKRLSAQASDLRSQLDTELRINNDYCDEILDLKEKYEAAYQEVSNLNKAADETAKFYSQKIGDLQKQINQFDQSLVEKNKTIDALQAQVISLKAQLTSGGADAGAESDSSEVDNLQQTIATLNVELRELQDHCSALETQLKTLRTRSLWEIIGDWWRGRLG